jgi:hypothetical protein
MWFVGEEEIPERELTPEERELVNMRKQIHRLAQEKPEEVAMIMRTWLAEDWGGSKMRARRMSGKDKAAVLMVSLGPELSASVFKHLKEEEIEDLTLAIAGLKRIEPQVRDEVIEEFHDLVLAREYLEQGGIEYAPRTAGKSSRPRSGRGDHQKTYRFLSGASV